MLVDEVTGKVVRCALSSSDLSKKALLMVLKNVLESLNNGKQSLTSLNKKDITLDFIEVANQDIKGLQRQLKKLGVDFSVVKSPSEDNQHYVYFKAKDVNQIQYGLQKHINKAMEQLEKGTIKEQLQERKLQKNQQKIKTKKQELSR